MAESYLSSIPGAKELVTALSTFAGNTIGTTLLQRDQIDRQSKSLTTAFQSEIVAMLYGLHSMQMLSDWVVVYKDPTKGPNGWADTARSEDYFSLYRSVGPQIGLLPEGAAEAVARYTLYMKMSRDATQALQRWQSASFSIEHRKRELREIVRFLVYSIIWAFIYLERSNNYLYESNSESRPKTTDYPEHTDLIIEALTALAIVNGAFTSGTTLNNAWEKFCSPLPKKARIDLAQYFQHVAPTGDPPIILADHIADITPKRGMKDAIILPQLATEIVPR